MIVLHIEHTVVNFETWKVSFDTYAEFREKSGVRRYRVARLAERPNVVLIDLEFDNRANAETLLAGLRQIWQRAVGKLIEEPSWYFFQLVESNEL